MVIKNVYNNLIKDNGKLKKDGCNDVNFNYTFPDSEETVRITAAVPKSCFSPSINRNRKMGVGYSDITCNDSSPVDIALYYKQNGEDVERTVTSDVFAEMFNQSRSVDRNKNVVKTDKSVSKQIDCDLLVDDFVDSDFDFK